ncbi:hypothetical protein NEOLEDRAFT_1175170 [Neolentinus lepideus HHB14362 ss-1]|uniref:DUF6533 domain-containing protein n=1 Tax=Neolentinus lepideus HHB14362 ss-1 TaxID=1314782 RepID=A0A165VCQ5_9AGAM|nr:hypothetical protein NEOLEDRAFT_1175170 [Neolentinus lepideus HHB14362 ss-1]
MQDLQLLCFANWAGYAILLLEFALTFADEVQYIWLSRWSLVKGIFLGNRYFNLVGIGLYNAQMSKVWTSDSPSFCVKITVLTTTLMFLSFASIHVLVLLRAWAVWNRRPKILASLVVLFLLHLVASIGIMVYSIVFVGPDAFPYLPILGTCVGPMPSEFDSPRFSSSAKDAFPRLLGWFWTLWLPSIVLESGMFIMTFVSIRYNFEDKRSSPVVRILYRDGMIYFVVTDEHLSLGTYLRPAAEHVVRIITLAVVNVAGQRLILHLRKVDHQARAPRRSGGVWIEPIETSVGAPADEPVIFESGTVVGEGVDAQRESGWWSRRCTDTRRDIIEIGRLKWSLAIPHRQAIYISLRVL